MTNPQNDWLETEIAAIRVQFNGDEWGKEPTIDQLKSMNSLISQGVSDHRDEVRYEILRLIVGRDSLESTKELSRFVVSCLIDYFMVAKEVWELSEDAGRLLNELETRAIKVLGPKVPKTKRRKKDTFIPPWEREWKPKRGTYPSKKAQAKIESGGAWPWE